MNDRWTQPTVNAIVVLGAVVTAGLGVWMLASPEGFAAYNRRFGSCRAALGGGPVGAPFPAGAGQLSATVLASRVVSPVRLAP